MIIWFSFFSLLMWCVTLTNLQILKHPCIPGINSSGSCCMILFIYCWTWFANILLWIFASIFIRDIGLLFYFCVCVCIFVWFWCQGNCGLVECIWECSPFSIFLNSLRRIGISSSLYVWQNSLWSHQVLVFCLLGVDYMANSISLLVISLFKLSISFWFSLGRLYVSINVSISSRLPHLLANNCS